MVKRWENAALSSIWDFPVPVGDSKTATRSGEREWGGEEVPVIFWSTFSLSVAEQDGVAFVAMGMPLSAISSFDEAEQPHGMPPSFWWCSTQFSISSSSDRKALKASTACTCSGYGRKGNAL